MLSIPHLDLPPFTHAEGTVRLPGSKSISNRVLLLSALCDDATVLHDVLDSDDTRVMLKALAQLGCTLEQEGTRVAVSGGGALRLRAQARDSGANAVQALPLFLGNAGTAMRPLTAALAVLGLPCTLSGVPRMHERPIGDLVDALQALGCRIRYSGQTGYPPLAIDGPGALQLDAPIQVRGDVSSQFLTALLMALPLACTAERKAPITIEVLGELISKPYIEITLNLMARYGVEVEREGWQRFHIPAHSHYQSPGTLHVEADASSASYFIALGALAQGQGVRIEGLGAQSIQGDIRFVDAASRMGAVVVGGPNWLDIQRGAWPLKAIDLDCNAIPDAAMTLAVMALYADGPCTLRNIASWRVKETDRIAAMATELRKLGAQVQEGPDSLTIHPLPAGAWRRASIHTYDDHRVAMCFSLAALNPDRLPVRIEDPQCVGKTFPDYFETWLGVVRPERNAIPVITIDGPTASGKGTLASRVAARLGFHYLDSGALYRVTAQAALQAGLPLEAESEQAIADLARTLPVRFQGERIWLAEQDITDAARSEAGGMAASTISAYPAVRQALVALQQQFQKAPGLVADGRDMGTVIFPNAGLKVFLTASAEQRAKRRFEQLKARGVYAKIDSLAADLKARDERDSSRAAAPLKPAQDALLLDNSHLNIEQSVDQVLDWWQARSGLNA